MKKTMNQLQKLASKTQKSMIARRSLAILLMLALLLLGCDNTENGGGAPAKNDDAPAKDYTYKIISADTVTDGDRLTENPGTEEENQYQLDGISGIEVTKIGSTTYVYTTGKTDKGISVFKANNDGSLTWLQSIDDQTTLYDEQDPPQALPEDQQYKLDLASGVTSVTMGNRTFLYVGTSVEEKGAINLFEVAADGKLSFIYALEYGKSATTFVRYFATQKLGDKHYLFALGQPGLGELSAFEITASGDDIGKLTFIATKKSASSSKDVGYFFEPTGIVTSIINETIYIVVPSNAGSGALTVIKFKIDETDKLTPLQTIKELEKYNGIQYGRLGSSIQILEIGEKVFIYTSHDNTYTSDHPSNVLVHELTAEGLVWVGEILNTELGINAAKHMEIFKNDDKTLMLVYGNKEASLLEINDDATLSPLQSFSNSNLSTGIYHTGFAEIGNRRFIFSTGGGDNKKLLVNEIKISKE